MKLTINSQRLKADFEALSQIGATPRGGVNRPALSPDHLEARTWLQNRIEEAGLEFRIDGAGNHSAYLGCATPDSQALLIGSHLDSVPNGGRYDGALGVLAALEALRRVRENGLKLALNLEAIDFTDEEGTLLGLLGSRALAGQLTEQHLWNPRGERENFEISLNRAGLTRAGILSAKREPGSLAGYLELHIEQGKKLEENHLQIGVVKHIPGIRSYQLRFIGRADHAGTVRMDERRDAALGASAFILAVPEILRTGYDDCYANVGQARFEPGAFNIVPEKAVLALEFRSPDPKQFDKLELEILERAKGEAERFGLELEAKKLGRIDPAMMHPIIQSAIVTAAQDLGLKALQMTSHAGHDAQPLASLCPAGMIFVPSAGGVSHSPREFTPWEDCENGANVLLQAILKLAEN